MARFGITGKLQSSQENHSELLRILVEASKAMKQVETCHTYEVGTIVGDTENVYVQEVWESEQAHQDSLKLPQTQQLIAQARPLLTGMERTQTLDIWS